MPPYIERGEREGERERDSFPFVEKEPLSPPYKGETLSLLYREGVSLLYIEKRETLVFIK